MLAKSKMTVIADPRTHLPDTVPTSTSATTNTDPLAELDDKKPLQRPQPRAPMSPEDKQLAETLMKKGDAFMKNGNIIVARQLYQNAAERGLPEAAYALAQTYDSQELDRKQVGVVPDDALAKKWYAKAMELGSVREDASQ